VTNDTPDKAHKYLCDLLSALLPQDRGSVVLMLAYFDESTTHDGTKAMCVSGYVFSPEAYRQFDLEWADALARAGVEYWHTVRSIRPRGPFDGKTQEEVDALAAELRGVIHRHSTIGVVVSVTEDEYDALAPAGWHEKYGGAYTLCLQWCLAGIGLWAEDNKVEGPFAYFFEAGHAHQGEANTRMNLIYQNPVTRARYHHASHTFADKKLHRGLQAADMLAWHFARMYNRSVIGGEHVRPDTAHLVLGGGRGRHKTYRVEGEKLKRFFGAHGSPEATGDL
jgi:hypothetical protein